MRHLRYIKLVILLAFAGLSITLAGCSRKSTVVQPPPQVTPPATVEPAVPAPKIAISASPQAIEKGNSTTLSWNSENATSVEIDGGIGMVGISGTRIIAPAASTTFTATASGAGGRVSASTRITVTEPAAVAPASVPRISNSEFFSDRVRDIFFDYDRYSLGEDSRAALDQDAAALAERPEISINIEGHCDERGSEAYNLALGDKRAQAAREYLIMKGISADRIDSISYGEERPFATGHDEAAWAKNRRAHFALKGARLP